MAHGSTAEIGYDIAENPVSIRDVQATILNQLGLNPFEFGFANNRLIGPTDEAKVLNDILA